MKRNRKVYGFWISLALGAGALAGFLTREGTKLYSEGMVKPPLSPPAIVFPVVWTVLYILMGISAAEVSRSPDSIQRSRGLNVFVAQLVVNFFWSLIFFNARAYGFALLWLLLLWGLVLWMILLFRRVKPLAAWLQLPYLLWVSFAAYLNWGVRMLNK